MIYILYTIIFFSAIEILYFLHKKRPFLNIETLPIMQSLDLFGSLFYGEHITFVQSVLF